MGADTPRRRTISSAASTVDDRSYALVRVIVAMPHVRLCNAIATARESTGVITVVAETGDIVSAVEFTLATRPGAVLLGISLVVGDVVEGVQVIARALEGVPVVLAGHEDGAAYEAAVMAAGAAAYLPCRATHTHSHECSSAQPQQARHTAKTADEQRRRTSSAGPWRASRGPLYSPLSVAIPPG